jgi:hypothetical protein
MSDDPFWSAIRKLTGLTDEQLARFDAASNHPYECRCPLCLEWWSLVPPENEEEEMVKLYRKKALIECERWSPGIDMDGVSISEEDKKNGSPRDGDRIARNPENPKDRWLISQAYFERNYEPF